MVNGHVFVVVFICLLLFAAVFSNKVVCEGDRLRLQCDGRDLRLVIFSASFGATRQGVPECPPQPDGNAEGTDFNIELVGVIFPVPPIQKASPRVTSDVTSGHFRRVITFRKK